MSVCENHGLHMVCDMSQTKTHLRFTDYYYFVFKKEKAVELKAWYAIPQMLFSTLCAHKKLLIQQHIKTAQAGCAILVQQASAILPKEQFLL